MKSKFSSHQHLRHIATQLKSQNDHKIAFLFPGQGTQIVGMGKENYRKYPFIRQLFDDANNILKIPLTKWMFEGSINELTKTEICQPAILLNSYAAFKIYQWQNQVGQGIEKHKHLPICLGHSLGEYTALLVSNMISFEDALILVRERGLAMSSSLSSCSKERNHQNPFGMISFNFLKDEVSFDEVNSLLKKFIAQFKVSGISSMDQENLSNSLIGEISNYNSHRQIVISGHMSMISSFANYLKEDLKIKLNARPLNVSSPFHSSLMKESADLFYQYLKTMTVSVDRVGEHSFFSSSLIGNVHFDDIEDFRIYLKNQIVYPVYWSQSIDNLYHQRGIRRFVEFGTDVLSNILKRDYPDTECYSIE